MLKEIRKKREECPSVQPGAKARAVSETADNTQLPSRTRSRQTNLSLATYQVSEIIGRQKITRLIQGT